MTNPSPVFRRKPHKHIAVMSGYRQSRRLSVESLEARRVLATMLLGQVVDDLNGNGAIDGAEPGQAGVYVYVDANENDVLDLVGTVIEPDDFADGEAIDGSAVGVTFSVADEANEPIDGAPVIVARDDTRLDGVDEVNHSSTGSYVFARDVNFFNHFFRLRLDFDEPVSHLQLDFAGSRPFAGDVGVLEAYTVDGTLVGTYQTNPVLADQYETMHVANGEANIAYATAYTHREDGLIGRLDNLVINGAGSEIWTITDDDGNYALALPSTGIYRINQVVPDGFEQTSPGGDGGQNIAITVGQTATGIDFTNHAAVGDGWQNSDDPLDVNGDGQVAPIDALLIINELNVPAYRDPTSGLLPTPPAIIPAYFDVDGDGFVAPSDAILVINYLNSIPAAAEAAAAEGEPTVEFGSTAWAVNVDHDDVAERTAIDTGSLESLETGGNEGQKLAALRLDAQHVESLFQVKSLNGLLSGAVQNQDNSPGKDGAAGF
jgi:hypothetical protein